jgi:putative redox protein
VKISLAVVVKVVWAQSYEQNALRRKNAAKKQLLAARFCFYLRRCPKIPNPQINESSSTMTSTVQYLGELRTEATHLFSGTKILTDAPLDNQGKAEAFSPTDLCATSLAACAMTIMGISARNHGLDMTGARADVTKVMAADPRRIARVVITFVMPPNGYTDTQKEILEKAARTCPVSFSLAEGVEQAMEFVW